MNIMKEFQLPKGHRFKMSVKHLYSSFDNGRSFTCHFEYTVLHTYRLSKVVFEETYISKRTAERKFNELIGVQAQQ